MNDKESVSWDFTGAKPGNYEVVADVGGPDDSKATLEIGNEKLPVLFKKTKGYNDYQPQVIGRIQLVGDGDTTASLRPDKEGWKAVNIRQITLRPVGFVRAENPGMKVVVDKRGVQTCGYVFSNVCQKPTPWQAQWISGSGWLRKEITLADAPQKVCCLA